jgi:hypothetical protein
MLSLIPLSLWSAQGAPWVVQLTLRATAPIPSANVYHSLSRRSAIDFVFSVDAVAGQT